MRGGQFTAHFFGYQRETASGFAVNFQKAVRKVVSKLTTPCKS